MAISNRYVKLPESKWILAHAEKWNGIVSWISHIVGSSKYDFPISWIFHGPR